MPGKSHQTLSTRGLAFICRHEGFRSEYYLDPVGVGTIGYGFTEASSGFRTWWTENRPNTPFQTGASIDLKSANLCMNEIIESEYSEYVRDFFGAIAIRQCVFDASVSMVYNCGPRALTWQWAMYALDGDYVQAARRLEKTATTAKGKRLQGLVNRRQDEALLLGRGDYDDGEPCNIKIPSNLRLGIDQPDFIDYQIMAFQNLFKRFRGGKS